MRRTTCIISAALCSAMLGCAGFSFKKPPGPSPLPEAWRPERVFRERLPRGGGGETVLNERDGLSPDEAAILAIDQNPRLRAARAERGIGQAELLTAGVLPNPRLAASLDTPTAGQDATVLGYGTGLSWNVTPLFSRNARVASAEENVAAIDLDIGWQEWQVAQAARLHTVRAIFLERRVKLARELEATWRQRLDALRQARAAGAVTEIEVTNAERSQAEARVKRLELQQQVVAERADLSRAIGIDPSKDVVLDLSYTPPIAVPAGEGILNELPRRRLDLIALQHAHRSFDAALRAAVISQFPPVEIGVDTRREVDGNASVGVALSFEIPFFDRNQGAVARERARGTQVEAEYDARLLGARADVTRTMKELALVSEQLVAAREASETGERLAEQANRAAGGGALSPLVAADILEQSYAARLRALEIEQSLAELHIALAVASGTDGR